MVSRIATAAIGVPALAALIWAGGLWFSVLVAFAAGVGAIELYGMARGQGRYPPPVVVVVWSLVPVAVVHVMSGDFSPDESFKAYIAIAAVAYLVWQVQRARGRVGWTDWGVAAGIALYTGGLLAHAVLLRNLDHGREWVYLAVLVAFATDTSAFFIGRSFGRRPLAPSISPGKTWEGAVGGLVGGTVACVALAAALELDLSVAQAVVLGAVLGVVVQLGDLAESRLKRLADVKNSGWLLPGHGGILDRLDSIVPSLVVVYYSVIWVV